MGNETFDQSRTLMDCVMGGRPTGRPLGIAEQMGANNKAAMQESSARLKLATAMV